MRRGDLTPSLREDGHRGRARARVPPSPPSVDVPVRGPCPGEGAEGGGRGERMEEGGKPERREAGKGSHKGDSKPAVPEPRACAGAGRGRGGPRSHGEGRSGKVSRGQLPRCHGGRAGSGIFRVGDELVKVAGE